MHIDDTGAGGTPAERGSAALELVVVLPVFLLLVLSVVQAALVFHARGIATAAAQEGLRAARMASGSAAAGQDRATEFLSETGGDLLVKVTVSANRGADDALVTVRGSVLSVVPGIQLPAAATAAGPVERFAQDGRTP